MANLDNEYSDDARGTPTELRTEADELEARARELRREAAARERHAEGRRLCEGVNRKGSACRNEALSGSLFCEYHQDPDNPARISPRSWTVRAAEVLRDDA